MDIDYEAERIRDMGHTDYDYQAEHDEALNDYDNGMPFPNDEYHKGVQNYRKIREENGYVLAVEVHGTHNDEYQYATWKVNEYGRGLDYGHYFWNNKDEALIDFKERAGLDLLDVRKLILDESRLSENIIHLLPKHGDFPEITIDFSDSNIVVKTEGEYPLPQKLFDWNESVADGLDKEQILDKVHRIVNEKMFVLFPTDEFRITSNKPNYDNYRLRVSDGDYDEYIDFLSKKVEEVFGPDCYYEIYWDYRDELSPETIVDAIEKYKEDGYDTVYDYLTDYIFEHNIDIDLDCIGDIEEAVQNCDNEAVKRAYELSDNFVDDLYQAGYKGINTNTDDLLSRSELRMNVMFATPKEENMDMGSIVTSFGSYALPDIDRLNETDLDNALVYLIHQQGHTVKEVYDCLFENPRGFRSVEPSEFVKSVVNEIVNNPSEAMSELTALIKINGEDLDDFIKKINSNEEGLCMCFDKGTTVGIYNEWTGGGSVLEIELEKDLVIPTSMVRRVEIESRQSKYTLDSVYGLCGSAWKETDAVDSFRHEYVDLKQENLSKTLAEVRAANGTQKQKQSRGR